MGVGLSTELGKGSLHEETKHALDHTLQHLRAADPELISLDLANFQIGNDGLRVGAPALCDNSSLTSLDLSYNALVGAEGVSALCDALASNKGLLHLSLAGNPIGDAGVEPLAAFLHGDPPLEELCLFHCRLTDQAVLLLANALQHNSRLVRLSLDMNDLTNASCIMLHQCFKHNKGLASIVLPRANVAAAAASSATTTTTNGGAAATAATAASVATAAAPAASGHSRVMDERLLEEMTEIMTTHLEAYHRRKRAEELRAAKAQQRQAREARERAEREAGEREEKARFEAELRAVEEQRCAEDAEIQRFEGDMARKRKGLQTGEEAAERARRRAEERLRQTIDAAYAWRDRMTGHGTLAKEWRAGFTIMRTEPGAPPGTMPTLTSEPPRRLQACWCDPQDAASAPYAKKLHYHCKHERSGRSDDASGAADGGACYTGCRGTAHVCSSVGFYSKPLPDRSAAHFFASEHRDHAPGIAGEASE